MVKRALDVSLSALGLVAAAPVLAAVAIVVRLADGEPVLFRQVRAGLGGTPFVLLKFRTMTPAPAVVPGPWPAGVPDDFVFKDADSQAQRITRVGRMLRRTSLDELPQLVNVLRGDMSLVGPRPELLALARSYRPDQAIRLQVKPGLTGWAQVTGRASHDHGTKVAADRYYVENASMVLDLRILLRTVRVVVLARHSY